jgi:hypothetical protein
MRNDGYFGQLKIFFENILVDKPENSTDLHENHF